MSWGYTFFPPKQLPLTHETLSEETVGTFHDADAVRAAISAHLPDLVWTHGQGATLHRGVVTERDAEYEYVYELTILHHVEADTPSLIVSVRCSGRFDSAPFAQRMCDATGWIAFDDRVCLFQPHRPPLAP